MKHIKIPVYGTSAFLLIYVLAIQCNMSYPLVFAMFIIGQALVIYMVYTVLKFGEDSGKAFDKAYWYDDRPPNQEE